MIYSLINIQKEHENGTVEGYWIQDVVGTLEKAIGIAYQTYLANSKSIDIAIVEGISSTIPQLSYWTNLKPIKHNGKYR